MILFAPKTKKERITNTRKYMTKIILTESNKIGQNVIDAIMADISHYESRKYWIKVSLHVFLATGTGYALFPTTKLLITNLNDSGFVSYFSLIFSDGKYVLGYIGDLALTLANSLPINASIVVISILIIFLRSLKKIIELWPNLSLYYQNNKIS